MKNTKIHLPGNNGTLCPIKVKLRNKKCKLKELVRNSKKFLFSNTIVEHMKQSCSVPWM